MHYFNLVNKGNPNAVMKSNAQVISAGFSSHTAFKENLSFILRHCVLNLDVLATENRKLNILLLLFLFLFLSFVCIKPRIYFWMRNLKGSKEEIEKLW